jgi:hypothetical protein
MTGPTGSISEKFAQLRELAKAKLAKGDLPATTRPDGAEGQRSGNDACVVCAESIAHDQFQYTVLVPHTLPTGNRFVLFHFLCHAAWQVEAAEAETASPPAKPPAL